MLSPFNRSLFYLAPTSTSLSVSTDVSTLFFLTPRTLLRFLLSTLKQIPLQFGWARLVAQPRFGRGKSPGREQRRNRKEKKGGGGRDLGTERGEGNLPLTFSTFVGLPMRRQTGENVLETNPFQPPEHLWPLTGRFLDIRRPLCEISTPHENLCAHDLSFWSFTELRMIYEKHL